MLSDKVHFLIQSLYACHVGFSIVCKFHFMSTADPLGSPVEIAHIYRTSYLSCDSVESCLPTLYRFARAFRGKSEMYDRCPFHLVYHAESHVTSSLSVYRDSSHLAKQPSERAPEKFSLYHAVRLSAYRYIVKV